MVPRMPKNRIVGRRGRALRPSVGFTAIEISAVASIIAILALILIPIVRNQVDKAKIVAAQDDMASIEKGMTIAFAETGFYFRLMDLTLPGAEDPTITPAGNVLPIALWNRPVLPTEAVRLGTSWDGPYYAIHRGQAVSEILTTRPYLFRGDSPGGLPTPDGGPILVLQEDEDFLDDDGNGLDRAVHPIDPWGSPYIFFGAGMIGDFGNPETDNTETNYSTAVVYTVGPDGIPGFSDPTDPQSYFRDFPDGIGTGDDLRRTF